MRVALLLAMLSGCASDVFEYADCRGVTLRKGDTCEVRAYYRPREGPVY